MKMAGRKEAGKNMELKTCNILGLDILVTDMEKTVNLIEQNIEQLRGNISVWEMCTRP